MIEEKRFAEIEKLLRNFFIFRPTEALICNRLVRDGKVSYEELALFDKERKNREKQDVIKRERMARAKQNADMYEPNKPKRCPDCSATMLFRQADEAFYWICPKCHFSSYAGEL